MRSFHEPVLETSCIIFTHILLARSQSYNIQLTTVTESVECIPATVCTEEKKRKQELFST